MSLSAIPGIYRKFETDATIAGKIWAVGSIACRYVAQYRDKLFQWQIVMSHRSVPLTKSQKKKVCYNNCICKPNEVILEPVGGNGNFDLRQGLFLDEHLVTELLPGVDFRPGIDQLFIGFELIGVTNPNMVVIIENLWPRFIQNQFFKGTALDSLKRTASGKRMNR